MRLESRFRRALISALVALVLVVVPLASADPPGVSITSGPAATTSSTSAQFSFTSPDPSATFECDVDGGAGTSCTSGFGVTVGEGSHTFHVVATSSTSETSDATYGWTVDTTPPSLSLPSQQFDVPAYTAPVAVPFAAALTASDSSGVASFSCNPAAGSSFPLGPTSVSCSATDTVGNTASGSLTVTLVDTTPPESPSITSGPSGPTADATPTFSFSPVAGASGYRCGIDTATPATACSGSFTPTALSDGGHTFSVVARDVAGNASAAQTRSFTVDRTPPETSITTAIPPLTSADAASISFSSNDATASFACSVDGAGFAACASPVDLGSLTDGSHTFAVRAADAVGNVDPTPASITWAVDATAPALSLVGSSKKNVEADGRSGTKVGYAVTGSDNGLALLPGAITCAPASGSTFGLGTTTVTCRAQDAAGNIGLLAFDIVVRDTRAPSINAPDVSFTAVDSSGIPATAPAVAAYLKALDASDLVSSTTVTTNAPSVFPIGVTTLVVTARDAAGNTATKSVRVTVLQPGVLAPPVDQIPPAKVARPRAKAGDRLVVLTWGALARDVVRVEVRRSIVGKQGTERLVFKGRARTTTSKGLRNGAAYRFVLVAFDAAGNGSPAVVLTATPTAQLLARPRPGARISAPPLLRWAPVPSTYFNVQLFRGSTKILSAWPARARYKLTSKWTYKGKKITLKPGVYTWYVWPGLGARSEVRYGELLGTSRFVVVAPKKPRV